jgi:large subunit ribosomal protein L32
MGLPAKKRTKSSKRRRASHFALKIIQLTLCSHCKKAIPAHQVCPFCGYYKGREVIKIKTKEDRKKRKKEKEKSGSSGEEKKKGKQKKPDQK